DITDSVFVITNGGLAGKLSLGASLAIGPVTLTGQINLLLNTTKTPIVLPDLAQTRLPAGPYFRIEGDGIDLTIGDQTLHGNFVVERTPNSLGQQRLMIGASDVQFNLGGIQVTDGAGVLLVAPDGIAGNLSASVDLSSVLPSGVSFAGRFGIAINNTTHTID